MSSYYRTLIQQETEPAFLFLSDLTSRTPVAMYSLARVIVNGYTDSLVRLRRSSDNAEQDFGSVNNLIDADAIKDWGQTDTLYIVYIYDQSGNKYDYHQPTAGNQMTLVEVNILGEELYMASISTAGQHMNADAGGDVFSLNNYHDFVVARKRTTAFSVLTGKSSAIGQFSNIHKDITPVSGNVRFRQDNITETANYPTGGLNQILLYEMSRAGSTSDISGHLLNSSETNSTSIASMGAMNNRRHDYLVSSNGNGSNTFIGWFHEKAEFDEQLNTTEQEDVRDNITSFYNF